MEKKQPKNKPVGKTAELPVKKEPETLRIVLNKLGINDPNIILRMAAKGMSKSDICRVLGISNDYMKKLERQYPVFAEKMQRANELLVDKFEKTLHKAALGKLVVIKEKAFFDKTTGQVVIAAVKEQLAPNVQALMYLLENRDKEHYRNPSKIEVNTQLNADNIEIKIIQAPDGTKSFAGFMIDDPNAAATDTKA